MSQPAKQKDASKQKGGQGGGSAKLRGLPKDSPEVRVSKTLSWILRHGAKSEGLYMRPDGFVRVTELVSPCRPADDIQGVNDRDFGDSWLRRS